MVNGIIREKIKLVDSKDGPNGKGKDVVELGERQKHGNQRIYISASIQGKFFLFALSQMQDGGDAAGDALIQRGFQSSTGSADSARINAGITAEL